MKVEIHDGFHMEYQIVQKCGRFRIRYRYLDAKVKRWWCWLRTPGIYNSYINEASTLHDAEVLRDHDIRGRQCDARGWQTVEELLEVDAVDPHRPVPKADA